jgi:hypothetical protein
MFTDGRSKLRIPVAVLPHTTLLPPALPPACQLMVADVEIESDKFAAICKRESLSVNMYNQFS